MGLRRFSIAAFMLVVAGCNSGGLLEVTPTAVDAGAPITGPSTGEMVSSGNVAKNSKYKVVYTLGQGTPNQAPATSPSYRDNGGLIGATNGPAAKP